MGAIKKQFFTILHGSEEEQEKQLFSSETDIENFVEAQIRALRTYGKNPNCELIIEHTILIHGKKDMKQIKTDIS